jgi:hypothetical protein
VPRACGDDVLPCSMNFNVSGALAFFRPKGGAGRYRRAQAVLLDLMVELRRLHLGLATAVAGGGNSWLD